MLGDSKKLEGLAFGQHDFASLSGLPDATTNRPLLVSLAAHCLLLFFLLRNPSPTFVKASYVAAGHNGTANTQIYWLAETEEAGKDAGEGAASSRPKDSDHARTEFRRQAAKRKQEHTLEVAKAEDDTAREERAGARAAPAGSPFGSLTYGTPFGLEVRPAYPIVGSDPVAEPGELPAGFEGDVVIEVTIDEQGNVIDKAVIQSINQTLDARSVTALANWRFRPATRNGVPIASKHDVYFHFRSR